MNDNINSLNTLIKGMDIDTILISDGSHTFGELYAHRVELFIALCRTIRYFHKEKHVVCGESIIWRSLKNDKGEEEKGWFLMGINYVPGKQITYHLPYDRWEACNFAGTLPQAPEFDGHTSNDVLQRLQYL